MGNPESQRWTPAGVEEALRRHDEETSPPRKGKPTAKKDKAKK